MTCVRAPSQVEEPYCWLVDNMLMFFVDGGVSRQDLNKVLGVRTLYKPLDLISLFKKNGIIETSCLSLELVDSNVSKGRIYSSMYESYLESIGGYSHEERDITTLVQVRNKYYDVAMGCGCNAYSKPKPSTPPPPFPVESSSRCICIKYKERNIHFVSNRALSNIEVEKVLREQIINTIDALTKALKPLLMKESNIGVLNGVIEF